MPTTFTLSDDQLFQRESGNFVREHRASTSSRQNILRGIIGLCLAIFDCLLILGEQISRSIGTGLVIVAITLGFAPLGGTTETAYTGAELGMIAAAGTCVCVDSGCTSTSVPENMSYLIHTVTDRRPAHKLYIANDTGLAIAMIGKMDLPTRGYPDPVHREKS